MSILLLTMLQAAPLSPLAAEQADFELYRTCVIDKARELVSSTEAAPVIEAAARARCRAERAIVELTAATNNLHAAVDSSNLRSPYFGYKQGENLARMDHLLTEDVADAIVTARMQRK